MDELVTWLRGVLDEIEQGARLAERAHGEPWIYEGGHQIGGAFSGVAESSDAGVDVLPHIALHDPRAALARVEAERAILDYFCTRSWDFWGYIAKTPLSWLAYGHRFDVSGWREEWAPEGFAQNHHTESSA